jgi:flagellar assembly protein FliH
MRRVVKAGHLEHQPTPWRPPAPQPRPADEKLAAAPEADLAGLEQDAREQGLAHGIRVAEESYHTKLARLDSLVSSLQAERTEFFDRIEPEIVRLAIAIAEKIIGAELELNPDRVLEMVRSAMKRLRDRESLRISVNPADFARVKEARDDLIGAVDGVRKLEIVEDRRTDPGGCVIESPNGTLDARVKTQIDQIATALTDASAQPPPQESPQPDRDH